jgi:hypothetical protein
LDHSTTIIKQQNSEFQGGADSDEDHNNSIILYYIIQIASLETQQDITIYKSPKEKDHK